MKSMLYAVFTAATLMVVAPSVSATTIQVKSDREMSRQSDMIVIGQCLKTRSLWIDKTLVTIATLQVQETLKGSKSKTIDVVLPGGIDHKRKVPVAMTYAGAPTLIPKEQVFLFLTRDAGLNNAMTITGFSQGKYNVITDTKGKKSVTRNAADVNFVGGSGAAGASREARSLDQFRTEIKGYLSNAGRDVEKIK
jgi:hypothetical protein